MTDVFDLPDIFSAKADPALIADDERQFAALAATLRRTVGDLETRLAAALAQPVGEGQAAVDRDLEVHRLGARLRLLRRFGLDLCLGRMVREDDPEPVYIGRVGLSDETGRRLLVDWRAPASEPFFGATHGDPMGLVSRRRYRWSGGRITDYWDEAFTVEGLAHSAALDDRSAFIASLGTSRSPRMRDVLGTIQADQDAVIRAGSRGALVVDGGPGTGKTVVALHRAAYLLYSEPRLERGGGVLFVGPSPAYLSYVDDILPSLGEDAVQLCTLRDLVPEGADAGDEPSPAAARLKETGALVDAIERAVALHERPPAGEVVVETPWLDVVIGPDTWADAFDAPDPASTHNEAREEVRDALLDLLARANPDVPALRRVLATSGEFADTLDRVWPVLDPADLVARLWSDPELLRRCAPSLADDEVRALQRADPRAWTLADIPLLDAARLRIGDPDVGRRRRERAAELAAEREERARVAEHLIASDDSEMQVMSILRRPDAQNSLVDDDLDALAPADPLAGPFAHIVVDEAQELTDAQWRMLLRRCPSRSLTIVGDRAQARHGFTRTWEQRLADAGIRGARVASLTVNYRTPEEVMAEAEPVIRAAIPDANVPTSVRSTGVPVGHASVGDLDAVLGEWLAAHAEGMACVIGDPSFAGRARVRSLSPEGAKGLEFDLVVLVRPSTFELGIEGAVDRYVAMTRATQRLVVLE